MGIKFLCPQGHKLHVKNFLRGKKAICPKCGARVVVPDEAGQADSHEAGGDFDDVEVAVVPDEQRSDVGQPSPTSVLASAPGVDAIAEAPAAVWYVRPATGGQFGPASGDIMRVWLSDGRVGASSLVWRAGWAEWRSAAAVFPQLGSLLAAPGVAVGPPQVVPLGAGPLGSNGASSAIGSGLPLGQIVRTVGGSDLAPRSAEAALPTLIPMRKRRRGRDLSVIASLVLAAVVLILIVALVLVFRNRNSPAEKPVDEQLAPARPAADAKR